MSMRSMKIFGEAQGSNVVVTINLDGIQVFSGTVLSKPEFSERTVENLGTDWLLAQFDFPLTTHGTVPLSLHVSGGDIIYTQTRCNYAVPTISFVKVSPDAQWPNGRPESDSEILADAESLTREQWRAKYGQRRRECLIVASSPKEDSWDDANGPSNSANDDGRQNVTINGVPQQLDAAMRAQRGLLGDHAYKLYDGETFNCDLVITAPVIN
jgi:hypothetical protein